MKNSFPKSTFRCIETIKLIDGEMPLLKWHQERVNRTLREYFKSKATISLVEVLQNQSLPTFGLHKIRIVYSEMVHQVRVKPYYLAKHELVKLVDADFEYPYKYEDREDLNKLVDPSVDDVIYINNGLLRDAWYSNLALLRNGKWYTPQNCLLNGVKRQMLIESGMLIQKEISVNELEKYDAIAFVNALRDFEKIYSFKRSGDILKLTLKAL